MPSLKTIAEYEDLDILLDSFQKISTAIGHQGDFDYSSEQERQYFLAAPQACKNRIKELFKEQEDSINESYSEYITSMCQCEDEDSIE